ncbi:MAG: hypothetical protein K6G28_03525 [Acholeplasmatales bacterium]|nr:hypothetical protein [Acholeplasmatales bacterium]
MIIGDYNNLRVVRKSDLGYMLTDDSNDEVLLHFREAKNEYKENDKVKAFLYYDKKHRLCATENEVKVTLSHPGYVEVVEIISGTGVFVSNNTGKDILISTDYLPYDFSLWPEVGDTLPVLLKIKRETIFAKPLNHYELVDLADSNSKYALNEVVEAHVIHISEAGISLATDDFKHIFVHKTMLRGRYHVGQKVSTKIIHVKDNNEYNGSLISQKEDQIDPDKEYLLKYLKSHNDCMPLDAKSKSEDVEKLLPLSRKAFKRALGGLYKDEKVYFEDGKTYLKK